LTYKSGRKSFSTNLVKSLEEQNPGKRLLIIRVDDHVEYYEIEKNKKLDLTFEMDDRLFKRVSISNDTVKGDETITISLESVLTASGETELAPDELSTNQELKKIEETLLKSGVLITGPTTEFEGEVSEVTARESSDSVYAMIRWSDGAASSLVFYANKGVLAREEEVDYEIDFEGSWSWDSSGRLQIDMDKGSQYIFSGATPDKTESAPNKLSTNQELKKVEETLLKSGVLITGPTTEFEGEVSEVTARESSDNVYAMIRWSDGAASSLVFYANKDVLAREEEVDYEIDFEGSWSWTSSNRLQVNMDEGSQYIFGN